MKGLRDAVIVAAVRTPVGKAPKGSLRHVRPDELGALAVKEAVARTPELDPRDIEDLIIGNAFPEAEQGMNFARIIGLRAGLPTSVSAMTVNRFCSSGLQAIALAANTIATCQGDVMVAGGAESMSTIPLGGNKVAPNPYLIEHMPEAYLPMGLTAEAVASRYGVSREAQDAFAVESHRKAGRAIAEGRFAGEIVPVPLGPERFFTQDEGVRPDTSMESLGRLKPAFHIRGTVTAGNASQTSDGAAALIVMSREKADALGLKPLAIFRSFAVAGVDPEVMGIGPIKAIPKALKRAGIQQDEVDLFELNEAFAAQALAVINYLELDLDRVNVNGGAIALGHPLGCTGAKLSVQLIHEMIRRGARYGVVSMCIGGGMGAAGVLERCN